MFAVDKYYPVQGSNKYETVSFPMTKAFTVDLTNTTDATTYELVTFPKGSIILGFAVRMAEALEATAASTIQFGFTGVGGMLSTAHASAAATAGTIITGNSNSALSSPTSGKYVLTAADTFDLIVGTAKVSVGGRADCYVVYVPIPQDSLSTSDFLSLSPGA